MCGIAGIIDLDRSLGPERLRSLAVAMRDTMAHRGPDDSGVWIDPSGRAALAHRRLSILDLRPEGRQPMAAPGATDARGSRVTFNGEIYNHRDLRAELEAGGLRFRTGTDTEVIPALYDRHGPAAVERLDGMFALAVFDPARGELVLARDPFGKKPLYIAEGPGFVAFASELQALRTLPRVDLGIDRDALGLYLLLQYVPHPLTIHRGVRKLPPGTVLRLGLDGSREERRFHRFAAAGRGDLAYTPETRAELKRLVIGAVEKRLMADVPLGAFLSSGVDSSLVAAVIRRDLGAELETFSVGFGGSADSEHIEARRTAELLGCRHQDQVLRPDGLAMATEIAESLDEPNGDSSCLPTYLLCRHAREHVTVALSGDGGDELFGGYGRYRDTLNELTGWRHRLKGLVRTRSLPSLPDLYLTPRTLTFQPEQVAAMLGGLPRGAAGALDEWRTGLSDRSLPPLHRMRNFDAELYLPGAVLAKVDRMSMRASLEVRCPLLDRELGRFAQRLRPEACWRAPDSTKRILKDLLCDYLPPDRVHRPKRGFGLPTDMFPERGLLELAEQTLLAPDSRLGAHGDPTALRRVVEQQSRPGCFSVYQLWPLLMLELWLRAHADRPATAPVAEVAAI